MPRTAEQNNAIKDKRREKILQSSLRVFANANYDKVAIDDINKASHCSHGLFYHYFVSKEAVFRYVCEEIVFPSKITEKIQAMHPLHGMEGIKAVAKCVEELQEEGPTERYVALLILRDAGLERVKESGIDLHKKADLAGDFCRFVSEAQKEGKIMEGEPLDIAYAFLQVAYAAINKQHNVGIPPRTLDAKFLCSLIAK